MGATCPDFGKVCAPAEPKSRPIIWAKIFIEKTYENDMNLLIFLDSIQKFQMLLSSRAKYPNFFLFLPITRANFSWFYLPEGRCIPGLRWKLSHHPWKVWEKHRPVISVSRIIMTGYQHSGIFPSRCIRYTNFFFSAGSILPNLSDEVY